MRFLKFLVLVLIGSLSFQQLHAFQPNETYSVLAQEEQQQQGQCIRAIIFDCDGTLVDNGCAYFLDWQYALRRQGYELNAERFWDFMHKNRLVGAPGADDIILKYCCDLLGRDAREELLRDKQAFSFELHQTYEFPAIEPTVAFLRVLGKEKEKLGLKVGLASANTKENILRVAKRLNLEHYFDVIVSREDLTEYYDPEGTNKPKPYIYLQASKLLGLRPNQCVAIEDSRTGVSSATSAGCITVAIPNAYTVQQDLSHADLEITSLTGMSPMDFLALFTFPRKSFGHLR